ncbi:hypothetical protein [Streptomyces sp. NPDC051452]
MLRFPVGVVMHWYRRAVLAVVVGVLPLVHVVVGNRHDKQELSCTV